MRILLCPDVENWAFDNIAKNIIREIGPQSHIRTSIMYVAGYGLDRQRFLYEAILSGKYDVVHVYFKEYLREVLSPRTIASTAHSYNLDISDVIDRIVDTTITTSVYDQQYCDAAQLGERREFLKFVDGYSVSAERIRKIYAEHPDYAEPRAVLPDGVDLALFKPIDLKRFHDDSRSLVVGWVRNSKWGATSTRDPKGLKSILIPAIDRLKAEGANIAGHFADVCEKRRTRAEMVQYYSEIDVLVCASEHEGTPNPALEAFACGVPMVSTDVGIIPELFGPHQRDYVLNERSVDAMCAALKKLCEQPQVLPALSVENLKQIREWQWSCFAPKWSSFWVDSRIANADSSRQRAKREYLSKTIQAYKRDKLLPSQRPWAGRVIDQILYRSRVGRRVASTLARRNPGLIEKLKKSFGI